MECRLHYTPDQLQNLPLVLSQPRFTTYLDAANGDPKRALDLYVWNSDVTAAFSFPLQLAEVGLRNGIATAIEKVYGPDWPDSRPFLRDLGHRRRGYNPASDLSTTFRKVDTTGKVIAELKFAFWQEMFTARHDNTIWNPHLASCFPNCPFANVQQMRGHAYREVNEVRKLRNRIAHHEPIFARNLAQDLARVKAIALWLNHVGEAWVNEKETVTALLGIRP